MEKTVSQEVDFSSNQLTFTVILKQNYVKNSMENYIPEFVGVSGPYGVNVLKFLNLRRSHSLTPSLAAV